MKRQKTKRAILSIFCLVTSFYNGFSQTKMKLQAFISPVKLSDVVRLYDNPGSQKSNESSVFAIDQKAMRDFRKAYKDIHDEKWYVLTNGFAAEFLKNDIKNEIVYDKSGKWVFSILYYGENGLDSEIREIVKKIYYDYTITLVEEIHVPEKIVYLVHMEGKETWKNVRVTDGEMELIEDYNKN
jgi:hypothetical protein